MRVVWFHRAVRDLQTARTYISNDNPQAARQVVERIRKGVSTIADHPAIGRPGRIPDTREFVVKGTNYILAYRVRGERIEILRILHAARKWPTRF